MELYWFLFVCAIFHVNQSNGYYGILTSPCPHIFQYQLEGNEWVGLAQVQSLALGQTMNFEVILSPVLSSLQLHYLGHVELYLSREDAIQEIQFDQLVRYRIRFATQNPLPKLVQIGVNGKVVCTGPPETGEYVALIKLDHTLFTGVAALSGLGDSSHSQEPFVIFENDDVVNDDQVYKPQPAAPEKLQRQPVKSLQPQPSHVSNYQGKTDTRQHECGTSDAKNNFKTLIVGGNTVKRGAWPWLVAVYLKEASDPTFNCGGNLISARTVITAAHCFRTSKREYQPHEVVLFLGRHNILHRMEPGAKAVRVKQIIVHSDYMSNDQYPSSYDADIAIAILRQRIVFTEYIRPICLWQGSDSLSNVEGLFGTVTGWGRDEAGNIVTPEPKKVSVPVVSEAVCLRSSDTYRYISSNRTFCAGSRNGTGPCNGDSGGGIAFKINNKWMLRGIVSVALADPILNTCNLGEFVVFTDVAKFIGWIKSYMR